MFHGKVVLLEAFDPACNVSFRLPETQQPAKSCMISSEQKLPAIKINMEMLDSFDYRQ